MFKLVVLDHLTTEKEFNFCEYCKLIWFEFNSDIRFNNDNILMACPAACYHRTELNFMSGDIYQGIYVHFSDILLLLS